MRRNTTIFRLNTSHLRSLFQQLAAEDYKNLGPVARDGAVMLETLSSFDDMPTGCTEKHDKGQYRLRQGDDGSLFQYTLGPQSFKKFLHPPRRKLWEARGTRQSFEITLQEDIPPKMAFWGVRGCDLEAIKIQDRIFLQGTVVNDWYRQAREQLFIIATGCTRPAGNCFCTSMKTGPMPGDDFDLSLVEVKDADGWFYLTECRSTKALELAQKLDFPPAGTDEVTEAAMAIQEADDKMTVRLDPTEAALTLKNNLEHRHWDNVAERCLSCANCTMVCPTCFCTTTEDITDITGNHTERWLTWDSCFNGDYSFIHGGKIRQTTRSRYRQWMTHKLSTWHDQFGTSGCVGCGRCITWCPVGIDITEELLAIQENQKRKEQEFA